MFVLSYNSLILVYCVVGFALGLVLERGRFCFVSAFRDIFMFRNPWLLNGILISIGVGAIGIGLLSYIMGVQPIMLGTSWLVLVGGIIFGVGVALAGACASGMLFRIPEGYVGNIFELVGFSAGILLWAQFLDVPLSHFYSAPISIPSSIGVPFVWYALVTGAGFLIVGLYLNKYVPKKKEKSNGETDSSWTLDPRHAWDPRLAGLLLALVILVLFVVTPKSLLGFTAPFATFGAWTLSAIGVNMRSVPWVGQWYLGLYPLAALTLAAFVGAGFGAQAGGNFRVRIPRNRRRLVQALLGGILAGLGAGVGIGCNLGNFYVGFAERMDVAALLFAPGLIAGIYLGYKLSMKL